jgi:hypothetical protein
MSEKLDRACYLQSEVQHKEAHNESFHPILNLVRSLGPFTGGAMKGRRQLVKTMVFTAALLLAACLQAQPESDAIDLPLSAVDGFSEGS